MYLEVEVETLTEQLQSPEVCEEDQNGSVTVDDLDHIQKVNRELEQQLSDKNRVRHLHSLTCCWLIAHPFNLRTDRPCR